MVNIRHSGANYEIPITFLSFTECLQALTSILEGRDIFKTLHKFLHNRLATSN